MGGVICIGWIVNAIHPQDYQNNREYISWPQTELAADEVIDVHPFMNVLVLEAAFYG